MESKKQNLKRVLLLIVFPAAILSLLVTLANPYELPLALLIMPFILIFSITFETSYQILRIVYKHTTHKRLRLSAGIIASGVFLLALLQSIRQLSIQDLIIIICLIGVLSFYTRRIDI